MFSVYCQKCLLECWKVKESDIYKYFWDVQQKCANAKEINPPPRWKVHAMLIFFLTLVKIVQLCNDFCTIFTFVLQRFYKDRLFFRPVVYVSNKGTRNICKLFQKCTTSKNTFELMLLLRNRKCKFVDCKRGALLDYSGGPTNKSLF